jgi:N-acetyl-beta-hexosaminidase
MACFAWGDVKGEATPIHLIPTPQRVVKMSGHFEIRENVPIAAVSEANEAIHFLNQRFRTAAGFELGIKQKSTMSSIEFVRDTSIRNSEAYTLSISSDKITIGAQDRAGYFYAVQTLIQLLPNEIVGKEQAKNMSWKVPCVVIKDSPKYPWRSFTLDSGRQYQTPEFIRRYLDYLAMLKINIFHWHLTEGQGWRIEIKKYPKLTEIGSKVAEGEEQQGFYSQDDIREIVQYANERCIAVVPEIDVPGHSEAALVAYPELTCFGEKPQSVMEYSQQLFCGGNESTYAFIENILDEVCELFPGEYVHLGGDEAPKGNWDSCAKCQAKIRIEGLKNSHELQLYFSTRLANYLKKQGKKAILWGDVVEQDGPALPDNVIIHWWNYRKKNTTAYQAGLQRGHRIICGTNYYTYLNFPVTLWSKYNEDRTFDLRKAYEANPSDIANPPELVLGMGVCLWTDWNVKMRLIDQRVFPRVYALAEQMWSRGERMPFADFYETVRAQYRRLELLGIRVGPALKEEVPPGYSWE